jgi:hypothetical protein
MPPSQIFPHDVVTDVLAQCNLNASTSSLMGYKKSQLVQYTDTHLKKFYLNYSSGDKNKDKLCSDIQTFHNELKVAAQKSCKSAAPDRYARNYLINVLNYSAKNVDKMTHKQICDITFASPAPWVYKFFRTEKKLNNLQKGWASTAPLTNATRQKAGRAIQECDDGINYLAQTCTELPTGSRNRLLELLFGKNTKAKKAKADCQSLVEIARSYHQFPAYKAAQNVAQCTTNCPTERQATNSVTEVLQYCKFGEYGEKLKGYNHDVQRKLINSKGQRINRQGKILKNASTNVQY